MKCFSKSHKNEVSRQFKSLLSGGKIYCLLKLRSTVWKPATYGINEGWPCSFSFKLSYFWNKIVTPGEQIETGTVPSRPGPCAVWWVLECRYASLCSTAVGKWVWIPSPTFRALSHWSASSGGPQRPCSHLHVQSTHTAWCAQPFS